VITKYQKKNGAMCWCKDRINQDNGIPILKKAMELKKKKNLEFMQGKPFATLHPESLSQFVVDVNLKLGANCAKREFIINNLMVDEHKSFNDFVEENPEIVLPIDLDLESGTNNLMVHEGKPFDDFVEVNRETVLLTELDLESDILMVVKENVVSNTGKSPIPSFKDEASPPLWTEVVRKGKSRSRSNKINQDDRRVLEY
jgi:hypothetical protein